MSRSEHSIEWRYSPFQQLSTSQLFAILRERQKIFMLEQQCLYSDIDEADKIAGHLTGWLQCDSGDQQVAAYLRVMGPGVSYSDVSIGRVLVSERMRGGGLGVELMQRGLEVVLKTYPQSNIRISAQLYLEAFYNNLGFVTTSKAYDEDGIPHIDMMLSAESLSIPFFDKETRVL